MRYGSRYKASKNVAENSLRLCLHFVILFLCINFTTRAHDRFRAIKKAGIFGSVSRGNSEANDIDLLVKIDRKISLLDFIGIKQELEDILGINVDLVEYDSLKPTLKDDILKEEVPL